MFGLGFRTDAGLSESLWPPSNQQMAPAEPPIITAPRSHAAVRSLSTPSRRQRATAKSVLPPETAMISARPIAALISSAGGIACDLCVPARSALVWQARSVAALVASRVIVGLVKQTMTLSTALAADLSDRDDQQSRAAAVALMLSLRSALEAAKVSELKKRLRTLGATDDQMDEVDDAPDPKSTAVQLLLQLAATTAGAGAGAAAASPGPAAAAPAQLGLLPKYVAADKQIRVGKPADATHGIQVLMGLTDHAMSQFYADPVGAIRNEFAAHGSADDKENLRCVLGGIQRAGWASGEPIKDLVAHPHAVLAKLQEQHVVSLRLYTTSSYCRVNDPLRQIPPQRPHPFPATTLFIDQGIKLMRAVAASLPDAHTTRIFWR